MILTSRRKKKILKDIDNKLNVCISKFSDIQRNIEEFNKLSTQLNNIKGTQTASML